MTSRNSRTTSPAAAAAAPLSPTPSVHFNLPSSPSSTRLRSQHHHYQQQVENQHISNLLDTAHHLYRQRKYKKAYELYQEVWRVLPSIPGTGTTSTATNSQQQQKQLESSSPSPSPRNRRKPHQEANSSQTPPNNSSHIPPSHPLITPFHHYTKAKCAFSLKQYQNAKSDAMSALNLLSHQARHSVMVQLREEWHQEQKRRQKQLEKERQKKFFMTSVTTSFGNESNDQEEKDSNDNGTDQSQDEEDSDDTTSHDINIRMIIGISCFFLKQYEEAIQYLSNVVHFYRPPKPDDDMEVGATEIDNLGPSNALQQQEQLILFTMSKYKRNKGISIYDENDFSYSEERVKYASENPLFARRGGRRDPQAPPNAQTNVPGISSDDTSPDRRLDSISTKEYERALLFRAKAYRALQKNVLALKDMNRLVALHPTSIFLLRLRGELKREMHEYASAMEDFDYALSLKSAGDFKVYTARGQTYLAMELLDEALEDLQASLRLQPQYAATWKCLGQVYTLQKDFEKAEEALTRTVALCSDDKETCKLLGDVCGRLGMFQRAKLYYHKALLLDYSYKPAIRALNELLQLTGQHPVSPMKTHDELLQNGDSTMDSHNTTSRIRGSSRKKHRRTQKVVLDRSTVRFALLVGNSAYTENKLRTPERDVITLQSTLFDLNFNTQALQNATRNQTMEAVHALCAKRQRYMSQKVNDGKMSISLFYFNGHAFQHEGRNYLIPVDFKWRNYESMEQMLEACISVDKVIELVEQSDPDGVNVYVFDSMRPHSLTRTPAEEEAWIVQQRKLKAAANASKSNTSGSSYSSSSASGGGGNASKKKTVPVPKVSVSCRRLGMAPVKLGHEESLVAFSHQPYVVAYDQGYNQGIFTRVLIEFLQMDSLFLDLMGMEHQRALFFKVKQKVLEESFGKQEPWFLSRLSRSVILKKVTHG